MMLKDKFLQDVKDICQDENQFLEFLNDIQECGFWAVAFRPYLHNDDLAYLFHNHYHEIENYMEEKNVFLNDIIREDSGLVDMMVDVVFWYIENIVDDYLNNKE